MENRLIRTLQDRIIGGVCGGLARYLNIEVVLVRLFFVVFTLVGGIGPLVYIILWIIVPSEEQVSGAGAQPYSVDGEVIKERAENFKDEFVEMVNRPNKKTGLYIGSALILIGAYIFLKNLNIPWLAWVNNNVILAGLVIIAGVALLVVSIRRGK
ncbi:MAG TPA: PspC domain-containing protein [Anaerolineaceae bacterium]|nr:PspC domain-containing protein [Anaerolineaceae bacterium]